MRKPRDYYAELKALEDKTKQLRQKRVVQLGELVIACGADGLSSEELAGVLLTASDATVPEKEARRTRGAAFFQRPPRAAVRTPAKPDGMRPLDGDAASP